MTDFITSNALLLGVVCVFLIVSVLVYLDQRWPIDTDEDETPNITRGF